MRNDFFLLKGAAEACLFVEDARTAIVMRELTGRLCAKSIKVYVSGGRAGVKSFLNTFKGFPVCGWVDRDFNGEVADQWTRPDNRLFQSSCLEIENYFLEGHHLTLEAIPVDADAIDDAIRKEAQKQPAWLAMRSIASQLHNGLQDSFIKHPLLKDIPNEALALNALLSFPWRQALSDAMPQIEEQAIKDQFTQRCEFYRAAFNDGSFKDVFSGKEILNEVITKLRRGSLTHDDIIRLATRRMIDRDTIPDDWRLLTEKLDSL